MKRIAVWAALAALTAFMLFVLAGCGGAKKIVAHVNNEQITEDEFQARTEAVTAANLAPALAPGGPLGPGRAGEFAMDSLIAETLVMQMAAERKCAPTDAQVNAYVTYAKKYQAHPELTLLPLDPNRTDADWQRDARYTVAFLNMLEQQVKVDPADVQKAYDQYKGQLRDRDQYHLRVIDIKSKDKAQKVLASLKKLPFETVALTQSEDPASRARNGDIGFVMDTQLPPAWLDAVKTLKPGEYAKTVIESQVPRRAMVGVPGGQTESRYFLIQLVEKKEGRIPTLDEVRPMVEYILVRQKDPGAPDRLRNALREYQQKSNITITLKPYDALYDKQRRAATAGAAQQPTARTP